MKKGLKAQLSKERQILLKSYLNENQKKNKLRTLSIASGPAGSPEQAGYHSAFQVHGALGSGYENSIEHSKHQFGSTISHGINFAKLKSSSLGPNIAF